LAGAIGASAYLPWMPMRSLLSFSAQTEAAAGVVIRQRHGFKDEKSAHKTHAGKQLFPEVHFLHLVRLQRRIHFFQPIDPTQVVFFPAAGAHHLKAAFFRRKHTLHPDPQI